LSIDKSEEKYRSIHVTIFRMKALLVNPSGQLTRADIPETPLPAGECDFGGHLSHRFGIG
jgi:hypothetical protein